MKKYIYKTIIVFVLLDLICLDSFAHIIAYKVKSYTININNILDDIEEIKFVVCENYTIYKEREYKYKTEVVPLFEPEEISVIDNNSNDYPVLEKDYLLETDITNIEYNYEYGNYRRNI